MSPDVLLIKPHLEGKFKGIPMGLIEIGTNLEKIKGVFENHS